MHLQNYVQELRSPKQDFYQPILITFEDNKHNNVAS